jgi:hemolysin III
MTLYPLPHSRAEHFADGAVHVIGVAAAIAGVSGLMVWAAMTVPSAWIWALAFYAAGMIATFSLSAAYNLTLHAKTRAVLRRFDHAAIYLMIAGTYTPIAIIGLGGWEGWALAIGSWALAIVGIVMKLVFFERWPKAGFVLYLAQGWLGVVALWPIVTTLPISATVLIFAGGITYTLGTIFYQFEKLPFSRAIWHTHVLAAAAAHYIAVLLIMSPATGA